MVTCLMLPATATPKKPPALGTIVGAIEYSGGPGGQGRGQVARAPGNVILRNANILRQHAVKAGRRYHFVVPPGDYRLSAKSGDAGCAHKQVNVEPGRTHTVNIICQVR